MPDEGLSREEQQKRLHKSLAYLKQHAPHTLAAHSALCHRTDLGMPMAPAAHHAEWVRILDDIEEYPFVVVTAPPGHGKTSVFSVAYPSWEIGRRGGNVRIGLISNTASQAYAINRAIKETIERPHFQYAYPDVKPDKARGWTRDFFYVNGTPEGPNPTLLASGVGGPILGKRFDVIVMDDPTTWEQARSETTMQAQRDWLKNTLIKRFPPGMGPGEEGGGRMVVICTRWSQRDLVPTLVDMGFKHVNMPALGYWDRTVDPESGAIIFGDDPLWPDRISAEQLEEQRDEDPLIFELVMQGNPQVLAGDVFDSNWWQRKKAPTDLDYFERIAQHVDTSGGQSKKKGDFFAVVTVGLGRHGDYWIIHVDRRRLGAPDQERAVHVNAERFNPEIISIEQKNEGIALYQRLVQNSRLPLRKDKPVKDKSFRAIPLANAYEMGKVWHPEGARWLPAYEGELEAFPNGANDDQVDAASGAFNSISKSGPRLMNLN